MGRWSAVRSIQIQVPSERARALLALAREYGAPAPISMSIEDLDQDSSGETRRSLVLLTLPNERAGAFLQAAGELADGAAFELLPVGTLSLQTPLDQIHERVLDVSRISTLELVLGSLQSIGAWRGMLVFSVLAGVIGGYGLILETSYLLVAAMLINPMGAPALVAVTGLAIGDARVFARGGLRFFVSLSVQAFAALMLGLGYGLDVSTAMMEQVASLSSWAVAIALAAGAAGAHTQIKSDRDSLVSATATGFMVAAALAPPAAVLGLSIPLGRWDYVELMAFLLLLQFLAIALGGSLALLAFRVRPTDATARRGSPAARNALIGLALLSTVALVTWQLHHGPRYLKADLTRGAIEFARLGVEQVPDVGHVEAAARFTRTDLERHNGEVMLIEVVVESLSEHADHDAVSDAVRFRIRELITANIQGVVPLVHVQVLPLQ